MNVKGILTGILLSFLTAGIFLFISAIFAYYDILSYKTVSIIAFSGAVAGVFIGSILAAKTSESKALLHSMLVCLAFIILVISASAAVNDGFVFHLRLGALLGAALASSFAGALFS